jgi:predicted ferric reductase
MKRSMPYSTLFARRPPAVAVIYALCGFIALISGYNLLLGVQIRLDGAPLAMPGDTNDPIYELGTSLGFWGFLLFGLNFVLATRWRWVEWFCGGLDQLYRLHGLIGRWTVSLILLHLVILVLQALPDWGLAARYTVPGLDLSYTLGGAGVVLVTLLLVVTIWIRFPYQRWLASHRWMGVPYLLGGSHAIVAQGDWYLWLLTLGGSAAWLYSSFFYQRLGPQQQGAITGVRTLHQVTELTMDVDRAHHFAPGQFVFLSVTNSAAGLPMERHPFSISAILSPTSFRISAKQLGDYTTQLSTLVPGDRVTIYGAYGTFGLRALAQGEPTIWIAGGIGVTPFLSLLHHLAEQGVTNPEPITFVWVVREAAEAVYLDEIQSLAARIPSLRFHLHVSATSGRVHAEQLLHNAASPPTTALRVLICGPGPMMEALTRQFVRLGVRRQRVISEAFAL